MNKTHEKRRRDIKSKLMAAICMLLVSSIMMVSSTYAWFTLSTAPEVTGINTAVGANGNLEMALLPKTGVLTDIKSEAGDSMKPIEERNTTWGNLVDLNDSSIYGLDQITLYPAALNLTDDGKVAVDGFILQTPTYGSDGRVATLNPNAITGYYDKDTSSFSPNSDKGVRAVGTASGMTPRQLSYRNARSAGNTAASQAANKASASLNSNGSQLANLAIKHALANNDDTYTQADVASLRAMVNDLKGTATEQGALDYIETAYMQYILAYAASAENTAGDAAWAAVEGAVTAEGATLTSVMNALSGVTLPAEVQTGIEKYQEAAGKVDTADTALKDLEDEGDEAEFSWSQISNAMESLVDASQMKLNGMEVSDAKNNISEVVSSVLNEGGLKVQVASGAGVYADIADQSGDYSASITIEEVEYSGTKLSNMKARMETVTNVKPPYLSAVGTAVNAAGAPEGSAGTTLPISDMYGYIIDLAFRTNAAESNLLLQADAIDRIYDNNTNEETMGHGSSMTFMATTTDFSNDQVKGLMDSINIVFFDPTSGTIYCYGGLDTANATVGADGVTAKMYLYNKTAGGTTTEYVEATYVEVPGADGADPTYREKTGDEVATHAKIGDAYVKATHVVDDAAAGTYKEEATGATHAVKTTTTTSGEARIDDNAIMALTQNAAHTLSVLVYLDGTTVTNADVAATGTTSMTGTMNLQFASSANLVPMDYAALNIPAADSGDETPDDTPDNEDDAGTT